MSATKRGERERERVWRPPSVDKEVGSRDMRLQ